MKHQGIHLPAAGQADTLPAQHFNRGGRILIAVKEMEQNLLADLQVPVPEKIEPGDRIHHVIYREGVDNHSG